MPPVRPGGALGPCGTTPDPPPAVFFECFAGAGNLSAELATYGVQVVVDEVAQGGTNFLDELAVSKLQENIERQVASGLRVALHLAPPCSTFSRARDRSRKTRLRSAEFPAGLPRCADQVKDANSVALAAFDLAVWASQLGVLVSIENPRKSYLWDFLAARRVDEASGTDHHFCACMHGAGYQKPTTLRCWNWTPKTLCKMCVLKDGAFSCGRSQAWAASWGARGRWDSTEPAAPQRVACIRRKGTQCWSSAASPPVKQRHTRQGGAGLGRPILRMP